MRIFIAINFQDPWIEELTHTISILQKHSLKGNFTRKDNLHLTVAFIGEVAGDRIDELIHTMKKVSFHPFIMELLDLGQFRYQGDVLYYRKVTCSKELTGYRSHLLEELKGANFSVDEKEFVPHITLGRKCLMKEGFTDIDFNQLLLSKSMIVHEICLMKSEQINGLLTYTKLYGRKAILE